ncbi:MAG: YggS family pyridoxal phosphate-dependent enzyme [Roseinatronobacter sp.]
MFTQITSKIAQAEAASGRAPGSVTLIAVSKEQPLDRVTPVLEAGHRAFGENKVQEAAGKWPHWREVYGPLSLHLLGPLQTNKARQAMGLFDTIHSLDRPKLAQTLARLAQETGHCPELFVQVNTGAEAQKSGILPEGADAFIQAARALDLPVIGAMCIPPVDADPVTHFRLLKEIANRNGLAALSMGMSDDFELAIAEGATHIRVGSAIFGARR